MTEMLDPQLSLLVKEKRIALKYLTDADFVVVALPAISDHPATVAICDAFATKGDEDVLLTSYTFDEL